jgi:tetratricopeptide (TPR) repeat protein
LDSARVSFEKCILIDSQYAAPVAGLANLYVIKHEFDKAEQFAINAIAIDAKDVTGYIAYCRALMGLAKNEEAFAVSNKILEMDAENRDGLFLKSSVFKQMGKLKEAIEVISTAITKYPNDVEMYALRASLFIATGKKSKAAEDTDMAKRIASKR